MNDSNEAERVRGPAPILRALGWTLFGCLVVPVLTLAGQGWFGAGDLRAFAVWTLPLGGFVVMVGLAARRLLRRTPVPVRYAAGAFLGLLLGLVFTLAHRLLLGPWSGAWSFPAGLAWWTGSVLGVTVLVTARSSRARPARIAEALVFLVLPVVMAMVVPLLSTAVTGNQHLTLVHGTWEDGGDALAIEDPRQLLLDADEALIRRSGLRGTIHVRGSFAANTVERPTARVLLLVSGPSDRRVRLPQPSRTTALYVQRGSSFDRHPADAPVLDRVIEIGPAPGRENVTEFRVENSDGSKSGADLVHWGAEAR